MLFRSAIFTGTGDIASIMVKAGLGIAALIIVVISTVTTTFLDAYSAGVSFMSISKKFSEKTIALIVCALGLVLAIFTPIEQYENFLYFIGSVFAPMIAILVTDFFILKNKSENKTHYIANFILWIVGFVLYQAFMNIATPIGNTVPIMIIVGILCVCVNKILQKKVIEK